jgi:hypothetical protein
MVSIPLAIVIALFVGGIMQYRGRYPKLGE